MFAAAARFGFQVLENMGGGLAQFEGGFGSDGLDISGAADAVGSKDSLGATHVGLK